MARRTAPRHGRRARRLTRRTSSSWRTPRPHCLPARLEGELRRNRVPIRFFADVVDDGSFLDATIDHATESPMGPLPDLRRVRTPIGVVGVFGSSNFPFAFSVPGGDTASALAAGCPVVIKAHPAHPATSAATFAALERAARRQRGARGNVEPGLRLRAPARPSSTRPR